MSKTLLAAAAVLTAAVLLTTAPVAHATILPGIAVEDVVSYSNTTFGASVVIDSNGVVLVGLSGGSNNEQGSYYVDHGAAFYYSNGFSTEVVPVKLLPNSATLGLFGSALSLSGSSALIGAPWEIADGVDPTSEQGAIYYYSDISSLAEPVRIPTPGTANTYHDFGCSVSLEGTRALVGAAAERYTNNSIDGDENDAGAVYYYSDITTGGSAPIAVRLVAPDQSKNANFGSSVNLSGNHALVGAWSENDGDGAVYYYDDITTGGSSSTVVRFAAPVAGSSFGGSTSLDGTHALVGASNEESGNGAAYYYNDISAGGAGATALRLSAPAEGGWFGNSMSLSGTNALISAPGEAGGGAVYYYSALETGPETYTLRFTGSNESYFGASVSLNENLFAIGTRNFGVLGDVRTGDIRAFTTLDTGAVSLTTGGLSFETNADWIIGNSTDANTVTVSAGDTATVAAGNAAKIGATADANANLLIVEGSLTGDVVIGAVGNADNELFLKASLVAGAVDITLYAGNFLRIAGALFDATPPGDVVIADVLALLDTGSLSVGTTSEATLVTDVNAAGLGVTVTPDGADNVLVSITTTPVPEPSTYALIGAVGAVGLALLRRRRKSK